MKEIKGIIFLVLILIVFRSMSCIVLASSFDINNSSDKELILEKVLYSYKEDTILLDQPYLKVEPGVIKEYTISRNRIDSFFQQASIEKPLKGKVSFFFIQNNETSIKERPARQLFKYRGSRIYFK